MVEKFIKDDVKIFVIVNGCDYQGWFIFFVECLFEMFVSCFFILVLFILGNLLDIKCQDMICVCINDMFVLSGVVFVVEFFYCCDDCGMKIEGCSYSGDLVLCLVIYQGGQWCNVWFDIIVCDICKLFGIEVKVEIDIGELIQDFKIQYGEKVVVVLVCVVWFCGVLVMMDVEGCVVIMWVGLKKSYGFIVCGVNVISMESVGMDVDWFLDYFCYG